MELDTERDRERSGGDEGPLRVDRRFLVAALTFLSRLGLRGATLSFFIGERRSCFIFPLLLVVGRLVRPRSELEWLLFLLRFD